MAVLGPLRQYLVLLHGAGRLVLDARLLRVGVHIVQARGWELHDDGVSA